FCKCHRVVYRPSASSKKCSFTGLTDRINAKLQTLQDGGDWRAENVQNGRIGPPEAAAIVGIELI
ncbi:MAG: hypothetical protein V7672_14030, partial [Brevundimonas sp.]|uniref:hypothetical protein n=1 Tax=Brevundimonas sp. TaxID=1871086 RepID=UPI00300245BC